MNLQLQRFRRVALFVAVLLLSATNVLAGPKDDAARSKIKKAIEEHYLMTEFKQAEAVLRQVLTECAEQCAEQVHAQAWLYLGIVQGAGIGDLSAARESFAAALALQPDIKLDQDLATRDTQKVFDEVKGTTTTEATPSDGEAIAGAPVGDMACTPGARAVQTNTVIPVFCESVAGATAMELRYKPYGAEEFTALPMTRSGKLFRAEIPCSATELAGTLAFYVRAEDSAGEVIDNFGASKDPVLLTLQNEAVTDPPAFPGEAPPAHCEGEVICPPDFPGCDDSSGKESRGTKDWGAGCDNSLECKQGLLCIDDQCQAAPSCNVDEDCPVGQCQGGVCEVAAAEESTSKYEKNWFGLHIAQDLAWVAGSNACSISSQLDNDLHCFEFNPASGERDLPYPGQRPDGVDGDPYPGKTLGGGFAPGTTRVMLSYDRALSPAIHAGVRLGYAFGGGPATRDGSRFFPYHAEARLAYWFARGNFRPLLYLGGGIAQVDARTELKGLQDCTNVPDEAEFLSCIAGTSPSVRGLQTLDVDVWKKVGQGFAAGGLGAIYTFAGSFGAQLSLSAMYMLPSSGFVLEPSLGLVYGL